MFRKTQSANIEKADNGYVVVWQDDRKEQNQGFSMPDMSPPTSGISVFTSLKQAVDFAKTILS